MKVINATVQPAIQILNTPRSCKSFNVFGPLSSSFIFTYFKSMCLEIQKSISPAAFKMLIFSLKTLTRNEFFGNKKTTDEVFKYSFDIWKVKFLKFF